MTPTQIMNRLTRQTGNEVRPGQELGFRNSIAMLYEDHRPLNVLPTGYGKTLLMALLADYVIQNYKNRVVILCGQMDLAEQTYNKFRELLPNRTVDFHHSSHAGDPECDIIVTLPESLEALNMQDVGLVMVDECHHVVADTWTNAIEHLRELWEGIWVVGLTATPIRTDRRSLVSLFTTLAVNYHLVDGYNEGYLIKPVVEYRQVNHRDAVKVLTVINEVSGYGKTIVFCQDIEQVEMMHARMEEVAPGYSVQLHHKLSLADRRTVFAAFAPDGAAKMCFQVDMLREGYDNPAVTTIVLCRKVRSALVFAQMMGRATRPITAPTQRTVVGRQRAIDRSEKPGASLVCFNKSFARMAKAMEEEILAEYTPPQERQGRMGDVDWANREESWYWQECHAEILHKCELFDPITKMLLTTSELNTLSLAEQIRRLTDAMFTGYYDMSPRARQAATREVARIMRLRDNALRYLTPEEVARIEQEELAPA